MKKMRKSTFSEFIRKHGLQDNDALLRVTLQDGSSYEAVWIAGLPDLHPSVDGRFKGIIGDQPLVFYLFDEARFKVWYSSEIRNLELLQSDYLRPDGREFLHHLRVLVDAASDVGKIRNGNEDCLLMQEAVFVDDHRQASYQEEEVLVFAVADGMGGHPAGDLASKTVLESLRDYVGELSAELEGNAVEEHMKAWFEEAHAELQSIGLEDPEKKGLGTTLCGLLIHRGRFFRFHAGDSRLYHIRKGRMHQLTIDHRSTGETHGFAIPGALTNCLGPCRQPYLEVEEISDVQLHDRFLLCSDGLSDMLSKQEIEMEQGKNTVQRLIRRANLAGGHDNITVMTIDISLEA